MNDGHTRVAKLEEIKVGMILRHTYGDGTVYPFADMVVTQVRRKGNEVIDFDCHRPYLFAHLGTELHGVESLKNMGANSLQRFLLVLNSKGEPYTMSLRD